METKDVILELRTKKGLSQDELAGKVMVTRQAVSRGNSSEYGDVEAFVKGIRGVDQYASWCT